MERQYKRRTLSGAFTLSGRGLHSGAAVSVTVNPGEEGIRFLSGTTWIAAQPGNVSETSRCTRLGDVSTIEHAMSALAGLGVTDADIEVVGGELPAAGGCAAEYVAEIKRVGFSDCGVLTVNGPYARVFLQELPSKYAVSVGEGWWRAAYVREELYIGRQEFEFQFSAEGYADEIAPARTFVLEAELEMARQFGLGQGLDESSCLVVGKGGYGNEARFVDEPSRHKLLDLIGDLALAGVPVEHLDVVAEFTSHKWNIEMAKKLAESVTISRS